MLFKQNSFWSVCYRFANNLTGGHNYRKVPANRCDLVKSLTLGSLMAIVLTSVLVLTIRVLWLVGDKLFSLYQMDAWMVIWPVLGTLVLCGLSWVGVTHLSSRYEAAVYVMMKVILIIIGIVITFVIGPIMLLSSGLKKVGPGFMRLMSKRHSDALRMWYNTIHDEICDL